MASCNDCGKGGYVIRSNATGNKYRCHECNEKVESKLGIVRDEVCTFARADISSADKYPYDLDTGWISKLKDACPDYPGINEQATKIRITSRAHEEATMKAMSEAAGFETHFGEKGETPGGHDMNFEPVKKIGRVAYSFMGKHRKASTCR